MAKIVELETDQKEVDEALKQNANPTPPANPQNEMQKVMDATMKRVYAIGLSEGMKVMCGLVIETLNKNAHLNPQRQLAVLRQTLNKHIAKQNEFAEKQKAAQTINSENQEQKAEQPVEQAAPKNEVKNNG